MDYGTLEEQENVDVLWKGVVRLDHSFVDCMSGPVIQDDLRIYTVRDRKFGKEDNAQFDNPGFSKDFPNEVTIALKGGRSMEFMMCHVFKRQEDFEAGGGFMQKTVKKKRTVTKGFFLEPLSHTTVSDHACLSTFQFDNQNSDNQTTIQFDSIGQKSPLILEKMGCAAFASGSQGTHITFAKDPRKSLTVFLVASDQRPFIAKLNTNWGKRKVICGSNGIRSEKIKPLGRLQNPAPNRRRSEPAPSLDEPLKILNNRLARGEITIYEYESIRKAMESKVDQSSTDWWV